MKRRLATIMGILLFVGTLFGLGLPQACGVTFGFVFVWWVFEIIVEAS